MATIKSKRTENSIIKGFTAQESEKRFPVKLSFIGESTNRTTRGNQQFTVDLSSLNAKDKAEVEEMITDKTTGEVMSLQLKGIFSKDFHDVLKGKGMKTTVYVGSFTPRTDENGYRYTKEELRNVQPVRCFRLADADNEAIVAAATAAGLTELDLLESGLPKVAAGTMSRIAQLAQQRNAYRGNVAPVNTLESLEQAVSNAAGVLTP